jgi:Ser/Thr protein kinase RdoA (MazF antagonist)
MNEPPFPVQRSLLSASALAQRLLPRYKLPGAPTCRFWKRSINDLYLVEAGPTKHILRVCPTTWRSPEGLAAEIELLQFLHRRGLRVPQAIPESDGAFVQTLNAPEGPRHAVLFTFLPGAPARPIRAHSHRFGRALAHLHLVTGDYPPDRAGHRFDVEGMLDQPLALLQPFFTGRQRDWDLLLEAMHRLRQAPAALSWSAPEYGLCHGDVNAGNLHLGGRDRWAWLDFEYFGYGWRVFDVATFVNNYLYQLGCTELARHNLDAFLAGYQAIRPLSTTELHSLPAFVILRQIWLLGKGAQCQPNVGLKLFEDWLFGRCLPFIQDWTNQPFWQPSC